MLNPNEKRLLYILGIVVTLCIAGVFVFFTINGSDGLNSINKKIETTENQIRTIIKDKIDPNELPQKIDEIEKILVKEKTKVYKAGEINIPTFGIQVRKLLTKNRLVETSMKTLTTAASASLQFQFYGGSYDFSTFLKDVSTNDKYWKIEDLFIKYGKQYATVDVTMRITYETANS